MSTFLDQTGDNSLKPRINGLLSAYRKIASDVSLIFVTNIRSGSLVDLDAGGVVNHAQHYTQVQADEIIRSFQSTGMHVLSYFSEEEFIRAALDGSIERHAKRLRLVFSAAEGGTGAGRRALVPAFCNLIGLPICNSGPHGCSVARHKFHANAILNSVGLRVPSAWLCTPRGEWIAGRKPPLGTKVIVKPTYESMAIGVNESSVQTVDESFDEFATVKAQAFRQSASIQEFISGYEVGVPIIEIDRVCALPVVGFKLAESTRFGGRPRTFEDENLSGQLGHFLFDVVPVEQYRKIQRDAVTAFSSLEMAGMGRIDMRIDEDGRCWIFDTNESPPPLHKTAYAFALSKLGFDTNDMLALWSAVTLYRIGILKP